MDAADAGRKEYPKEELRDCCKKFLLNQFHDILPGSHINPVYQDAMQDYGELESRLDALLDEGGERFFNTLNQRRGKQPSFRGRKAL